MNDTHDLTTYSASKLAELIRNNVASSEEVVEAHVSRIKKVNPRRKLIYEFPDLPNKEMIDKLNNEFDFEGFQLPS